MPSITYKSPVIQNKCPTIAYMLLPIGADSNPITRNFKATVSTLIQMENNPSTIADGLFSIDDWFDHNCF